MRFIGFQFLIPFSFAVNVAALSKAYPTPDLSPQSIFVWQGEFQQVDARITASLRCVGCAKGGKSRLKTHWGSRRTLVSFSLVRNPLPVWVALTLFDTAGYNASLGTNALVTLTENESAPPLNLQPISPPSGLFDLTLTGSATRLFDIETSNNLPTWQPFATLLTVSNSVRLLDWMPTNESRLFFRARE